MSQRSAALRERTRRIDVGVGIDADAQTVDELAARRA
jgi:hypothetical protein